MEQSLEVVKVFNHEKFGNIRTVVLENEIWFVGKDVAEALGYSNPQKALRDHVTDKFKRTERIVHPSGGAQESIVINEAGMYKLVLRSKLPSAEEFSDWLCQDVIPSIRKHGVYATGDFLSRTIADPAWAIGILTELKAKQEEAALLKQQLAESKSKADYCDAILQCPDLVTTGTIAKDYGFSAKKFNKLLHEFKVQFKQGDLWLLYQKYAEHGWSSTKTYKYIGVDGVIHCRTHMYWTQKGRLELYRLLKENGILPLIEQTA